MTGLNIIAAKLQARYILKRINSLDLSREDKLKLIDAIIADIENNDAEQKMAV